MNGKINFNCPINVITLVNVMQMRLLFRDYFYAFYNGSWFVFRVVLWTLIDRLVVYSLGSLGS